MGEIVAELSQLARQSPHLNQHSGVSVRLSITNYETLVANALRRALKLGEPDAVPRVSDLGALVSSTQGKVEIEALEEGRRGEDPAGARVCPLSSRVFRRRVETDQLAPVVSAFDDSRVVHAGDDLPASAYTETFAQVPELEADLALSRRFRDSRCRRQRRRAGPRRSASDQEAQQGRSGLQSRLQESLVTMRSRQ